MLCNLRTFTLNAILGCTEHPRISGPATVTQDHGHAIGHGANTIRMLHVRARLGVFPVMQKMSFNSSKALEIAKYFLEDIEHPINAIPVVLFLLCFIWSGSPRCIKRSTVAWWALINGCMIHCWMDG